MTSGACPGRSLPRPALTRQPVLLRRLLRDPQPVLDELAATVGPVCALGGGPLRVAVVGDPAALRDLFALPADRFRWGHRFNVLGFVVGDGSMIVSDGADHRRRRTSVQAAFGRRRLNDWIPMIVDRADQAIDDAVARASAGDGIVDLAPIARALTLDVVVTAMFGATMRARTAEIGELFERPQAYLESPALRQLPHPFPGTARARARDDRRALDALIDEAVAVRRSDPEGADDVLTSLVGNPELDAGEIRDQVVTLIGAGYDTTAASLSWMLWRTALEPGLWDRLRDEADAVLGVPPATHVGVGVRLGPDTDALARLRLADGVMHETLRLHPAGAISPRQAAFDIVVGGYAVPKGTLVLWSAYLAGRSPEVWSEPLRFDPERFADRDRLTGEQRALVDAAWVPFGRGARMCIGFALAQMELTLALARFAQRLEVTPTSRAVPRPVGMVVNRPEGGVRMRVNRRRVLR